MIINYYNSVKTSLVKSNIDIKTWFSLIKYGTLNSYLIKEAREKGKGSERYTQIKQSIPCVTYNFLFSDRKTNKNILNATGLIYIDIDNEDFDIKVLDLDYIFAYYKSFGGKGYSILVKVDGLTLENFKQTYLNVCKFLKIEEYIDMGAVKATQYSILSLDSGIYSNFNSKTVPPSLTNLIINNKLIVNKHIVNEGGTVLSLRFDNFSDLIFDEKEMFVNWDGVDFIKCFEPYSKKKSHRNSTLLSYCNNLVYLNENITKQRAMDALSAFNNRSFENPVDNTNLRRIIDSIFKYKENGTLKPIYHLGKRKIVFKPQTSLTKSDKTKLIIKSISEKKKRDSIKKLEDIILKWNENNLGKISIRKISENFPISKKTVSKYYNLFNEEILTINNKKIT